MDHLDKIHNGPSTNCADRTPVEQLAHERRLGFCDCLLEDIYGDVKGWVNPNAS